MDDYSTLLLMDDMASPPDPLDVTVSVDSNDCANCDGYGRCTYMCNGSHLFLNNVD